MSTMKMLATGLAAVAALAIADRASAQTFPSAEEFERKVERTAPRYPAPGKVMCACAVPGFSSRAVGYLSVARNDHGDGNLTVDVYCIYQTYDAYDGHAKYARVCADYELLK